MSWTVESSAFPGLYNVYDEDGNRVTRNTTHERATLIASAPDLAAEVERLRTALKEMVERFSHYTHDPIPPIQPGCQADDQWLAIRRARSTFSAAEEIS